MQRVRKLGDVVFDKNAMYVEQDTAPNGYIGRVYKSAAGTNIEYVAKDNNPDLTLVNNGSSVIDEQAVDTITAMWLNLEDTTITYTDGTTQAVRFRMDQPPTFTELSPAACLYLPVIYLTKLN